MRYHYFGRKILERRTRVYIYVAAVITIINLFLNKLVIYLSPEVIYLGGSYNSKVFGISNLVVYPVMLVCLVLYLLDKIKSASAEVVEIMYFVFKILTIIISLIFLANIIFIIRNII